MSSIMLPRPPAGSCSVLNAPLVEELVIDSEDHINTRDSYAARVSSRLKYVPRSESLGRRSKRPHSVPVQDGMLGGGASLPGSRGTPQGGMDAGALTSHSLKLQQWLNDKQVKALQNSETASNGGGSVGAAWEEKADTEARNTRKMYESVLDTEDTFVKDMANFLHHKDMLNHRKKELLHKKWTENVNEPIRKEIDKEINGPNYLELVRRKNELYKEYLEHTNKKGHVFLDVIAPDEYYPMSLHPTRPSLLVAETGKLRDPLLGQERERAAEDRVMFRCMTGCTLSDRDIAQIRLPPLPLVPLGRHGTECRTWIDMPMGDIESPVRNASRSQKPQTKRTSCAYCSTMWDAMEYEEQLLQKPCCRYIARRMVGDSNFSHFGLEEWAKPPAPPSTVERELQIQKRRRYLNNNPNYMHVPRTAPNPNTAIPVCAE